MKFTLTVQMDNDTFADDPAPELQRIMCLVSAEVARYQGGTIRDACGNQVGQWEIQR